MIPLVGLTMWLKSNYMLARGCWNEENERCPLSGPRRTRNLVVIVVDLGAEKVSRPDQQRRTTIAGQQWGPRRNDCKCLKIHLYRRCIVCCIVTRVRGKEGRRRRERDSFNFGQVQLEPLTNSI
ncbi:hypothetical protein J6590_008182 [Homalodisca vitripennis]|nr:hypothetical protein J6590_008182 [Homalodisca vitripennis]